MVFNKEIDRLYRIMYEEPIVSDQNRRFLEEIVDEIVTNDKCIIEDNPAKTEIILKLIDLVDAYSKNRQKYLRNIKNSANIAKNLNDQPKKDSCK
ncbi:MAG: hypothetical protein ACM3UN_00215 [Bacillota bacterium]